MRDRRGRGRRGPLVLPGPLSPGGVPTSRSRSEVFDAVVLDVVADLEAHWEAELRGVEFGVEEVPLLPTGWRPAHVPLATVVRATGTTPARIVAFRLPVQQRATGRADLERLVRAALVERVAELLGRDPDDVDPPR
ncbi:MAG: metallopeptidase family protein [Nocardioidaceae bacterium]|nr:metallopeptidase family protein [Nocardioidaceae bacterium]